MNKELLEQYKVLKIELDDLEARINNEPDLKELLFQQIEKIKAQRLEIELFINSIPDSFTRSIMRFYFIDGMTWRNVSKKFGEGFSEDMCRKNCQRYLAKI